MYVRSAEFLFQFVTLETTLEAIVLDSIVRSRKVKS
jgi:hypothetical protein